MSAENARRAIVWDTVERLAFLPQSDQDSRKWISIFELTLPKLWQVQQVDIFIKQNPRGFSLASLDVACEYTVEAKTKFAANVSKASEVASTCWSVDVDPTYCSKSTFYASPQTYPRQDEAKYLEADVKCVLDGMIFHPRCHTHVEGLGIATVFDGNGAALSAHEVRLGGGIENAYVFLTHLRYQFCLVSNEVRKEESRRLTNLFTQAIIGRKNLVPPTELFDFKR